MTGVVMVCLCGLDADLGWGKMRHLGSIQCYYEEGHLAANSKFNPRGAGGGYFRLVSSRASPYTAFIVRHRGPNS